MAEKDITEKALEAYNDVFADIVNVILFKGQQIVKTEELRESTIRSHYKADGKLHEQERDISKYWKSGNIRITLLGFENQTSIDPDMPFRVIGYDGASYRTQLLHAKYIENSRYPIITMVLYFGEKYWSSPLQLSDCMNVPDELKPFFNDYKANLFQIAYLSDEQLSCFRSDFRIVADYFIQIRRNKCYTPQKQTINHVHAVLELMSVLTGDSRFEEVSNNERSITNMCEVLDKIEEKGFEQGIFQAILCLMKTKNMSAEEAMDALLIPEKERAKFVKLLDCRTSVKK